MATTFKVPADVREDTGRGASRRLRREGKVPAILYGGDRKPTKVAVDQHFAIRAIGDEHFFTSILELKAGDGRAQKAILRDVQYHPYKQEVLHFDFQRVSDKEKLRINVPLHFEDEATSPAGRAVGVVISHRVTDLEILCLPKDLPEFIAVQLAELDVGDSVHLDEIELPEGVELVQPVTDDFNPTLVTANYVTVNLEEPEEDEDEVDAAEVPASEQEGEEGEEGAAEGDGDKVEGENAGKGEG